MLPELDDCILDHVAIAVNDLEESVKMYTDLGLKFSKEREVVEEQKVKTAFAHIDTNAHIELLKATSEDSAIQKFIDKNGPGIHHLCFRVKDVVAKQEELLSKGFRFIYPEPKIGAGNCLVNFIHPKSTGGVLIEISQKPNS
jgi:methylmalonyl-CoA/ethylmalonyl-CoA epimerase